MPIQQIFANTANVPAFTPVTHQFTDRLVGGVSTDRSQNETVPTGATQLVVELWGPGGGGGGANGGSINPGGGGGAGGYCKSTIAIDPSDWGKTLAFVVAAGGLAGTGGGID